MFIVGRGGGCPSGWQMPKWTGYFAPDPAVL